MPRMKSKQTVPFSEILFYRDPLEPLRWTKAQGWTSSAGFSQQPSHTECQIWIVSSPQMSCFGNARINKVVLEYFSLLNKSNIKQSFQNLRERRKLNCIFVLWSRYWNVSVNKVTHKYELVLSTDD